MSLINQMLKDLEKRKDREQTASVIPIAHTYDTDQTSRQSKIITGVIIGSLLLVFISLFQLFFNSQRQNMQQIQTNKLAPVTQTAPPAVDNAWLTPVNITGITMQTRENITEITFMLNHAALYEITSNGMQNQLVLIIEQSQLLSEILPAHFLNASIQSLNASQLNGDTRFNLTLNPNASLKYVSLINDDKNPELVIAIENRPVDTQNVPVQRNAAIKTPAAQSLILQKYQIALDEAKLGKLQQAIANLSALLEVDPEYQDARTTLAALLMDKGNRPQASKIINEGLNIFPGYAPFVELKARLLTQDGKIQQALNLLQSAVPPITDNPDYHALIAALYERSNKDLFAIRTYQKLLALDPHNGSWWFGLAVSYDKVGKTRDATTAYERAMSEGHLNSASLAYLQKRLESLQEADNAKA